MRRFRIDFKSIFLACIGVMVLDKIMIALDSLPPLFNGADILYHIFASAISIFSQLAVSVAAAIIFYYIIEFYNIKRNIEKYIELRKDLLFILYAHMALVRHTNEFDYLNQRQRRVDDDVCFDMNDIPYLLHDFDKWDKEKAKSTMVPKLITFFNGLSPRLQDWYINRFQKEIDSLKLKRDYRYIKGSSDDIDNIVSIHQDMMEYYDLWKVEGDTQKKEQFLSGVFSDYIDFFNDSVNFYQLIQMFISCVDRKDIILYLKMLY